MKVSGKKLRQIQKSFRLGSRTRILMSFPEVREAVIGYADQMVYGHTYAADSLYQSIPEWEKKMSTAIPLIRRATRFFIMKGVASYSFQQPFKPSPRKGMSTTSEAAHEKR